MKIEIEADRPPTVDCPLCSRPVGQTAADWPFCTGGCRDRLIERSTERLRIIYKLQDQIIALEADAELLGQIRDLLVGQ